MDRGLAAWDISLGMGRALGAVGGIGFSGELRAKGGFGRGLRDDAEGILRDRAGISAVGIFVVGRVLTVAGSEGLAKLGFCHNTNRC